MNRRPRPGVAVTARSGDRVEIRKPNRPSASATVASERGVSVTQPPGRASVATTTRSRPEADATTSPRPSVDTQRGSFFQGPEGPPGPQGDPGVGVAAGGDPGQVLVKLSAADYDTGWADPAFRWVQVAASTQWTITHGLGFRPSVTVEDSSGADIIPGAIRHLDNNTVVLDFSAAVGGEAYLS